MKRIFALLLVTCHLSLATAFAQGPRTPVVDAKFLLAAPASLTAPGNFWAANQSTQNYDSGTLYWTMTSTAGAPPTTCSIAVLGAPTVGGAGLPVSDNNGTQSCLTGGIATVTIAAGGSTTYVVGDVITVTQAGASGGQLVVTGAVAGVVTSLAVLTPGKGYSPAATLATTGGSGTLCTVNITLVGGQSTVGNLPMFLNASLNLAAGTLPVVTLNIVLSNWQVSNLQAVDVGGNGTANAAVSSASLLKDVSSPGSTKSIFLKGFILEKMTATTGTVTFRYGTGTNCGTGTTTLFFLGPQTATSPVNLGYYAVNAAVPAGNDLCEIDDAVTTSTVSITQ